MAWHGLVHASLGLLPRADDDAMLVILGAVLQSVGDKDSVIRAKGEELSRDDRQAPFLGFVHTHMPQGSGRVARA